MGGQDVTLNTQYDVDVHTIRITMDFKNKGKKCGLIRLVQNKNYKWDNFNRQRNSDFLKEENLFCSQGTITF